MARYVFDCETDGLLPELTKIHSLVLKDLDTGEMFSCCDNDHPMAMPIADGLALLAAADYLCGHNIIGFDIPAIQKVYPWWKPKAGVVIRDTLVEAMLMWPKDKLKELDFPMIKGGFLPGNMLGAYGLEAFGYRLKLLKGTYSADMKALGFDPWAQWRPEMQRYCEKDVAVTAALRARLDAEKWPEPSVELEHRVHTILLRQERHGFRFDTAAAGKLAADLVQKAEDLKGPLAATFAPWFKRDGKEDPGPAKDRRLWVAHPEGATLRKHPKTKEMQRGWSCSWNEGAPFTPVKLAVFNPDSRDHIADRLKKVRGWVPTEFTPEGKVKVDEKVLGQLPYPEAKALTGYMLLGKRIGQISTGKEAWLRAVKPNGRVHGRVVSNGCVTGRMTHMRPNMGQVPSIKSLYGKECRALFLASTGMTLVGADADALELRCLGGYMAKFDGGEYIRVILEGDKAAGTDMHSVNARALGLDPKKLYPVDGKLETGRDIAKVWFYAFIYGAGDGKLGEILGIRDPDTARRRGKKSRESFLRNLPALGKLVEAVQKAAKTQGFIRGIDRRRIHVRGAHSALNTVLQSAGAIFMKQALVILDDALQAAGYVPGVDYEFCANVHDEWQIDSKPEIANDIGLRAKAAIVAAGAHFEFPCPLDGAFSIGSSWAETH